MENLKSVIFIDKILEQIDKSKNELQDRKLPIHITRKATIQQDESIRKSKKESLKRLILIKVQIIDELKIISTGKLCISYSESRPTHQIHSLYTIYFVIVACF